MRLNAKKQTNISGLSAVIIWFASGFSAQAETRNFDCNFLRQYSSAEISAALSYAGNIVGPAQASNLYSQYVALKRECASNPSAHRSVSLSPAMISLIGSR